ncbi:MAG: hypothetical protein HFI75_06060 [Lachnospiraceae bacterium]|nr:hypothetical protein [Lachnospiraceae bacterium]
MPFIHSRVSATMTQQQKETIIKELGEAIAIIPGKSEEWLMVELADQCDLYFRGRREKALAYIEVKVFGKISADAARSLTERICAIYETHLQIERDCVYIKYEEVSKWGWNGSNF